MQVILALGPNLLITILYCLSWLVFLGPEVESEYGVWYAPAYSLLFSPLSMSVEDGSLSHCL